MAKSKSLRAKHLLLAVLIFLLLAAGTGLSPETRAREAVIIDNFDITASVSGTPLKEAYKDYF